MNSEELKEKLLETNCFEDNEWLDKYIDILFNYENGFSRFENHHVFPVSNLRYCFNNSLITKDVLDYFNSYTISIPKVYHILAHLYLSRFCKYSYMRDQNCSAVRMMLNDKSVKFSEINSIDDLKNICKEEINYWSDERRDTQSKVFYSNITKWRKEHLKEFSEAQSRASKHQLGHKFTEERKNSISIALTLFFDANEAAPVTEETRNKISNSLLGHDVANVTKDKLSNSVAGFECYTNGNTNLHLYKNEIDFIPLEILKYRKGTTKGLKCKNNKEYYICIKKNNKWCWKISLSI